MAAHRTALARDAGHVFALAGSWAPYRRQSAQQITTSLLLYALVEADAPNSGDRQLREIIEPFLATLGRWRGYRREMESYFTKDVRSVDADKTLQSVTGLSKNVQTLLIQRGISNDAWGKPA